MANSVAADAPTHIFAAYSKANGRISLQPTHVLVLAVHCVHLPFLPYSKPGIPAEVGSTLTLSIAPLIVSNIDTLQILLRYLYTKREDHLYASLLPVATLNATWSTHKVAEAYAANFTVQKLLANATRVHSLWLNMKTLGVVDEKLWRCIGRA